MQRGRVNLNFVPVTAHDAKRLQEVAVRTYRQHFADLWTDGADHYLSKAYASARLREEIVNPLIRYFLIEKEGLDIGFLMLVLPSDDIAEDVGFFLKRIYLDAVFTRSGVGAACMTFIEDYARAAGMDRIWLQVVGDNADGQRFYERHGYNVCGQEILDEPYVMPGRELLLIMEKYLGNVTSGQLHHG